VLTIVIPATELYDEVNNEFVRYKEQTLQLEHSLVSLSKWESKWCKPFLAKTDKTMDESIDYIRCMTITQNVAPEVYSFITRGNLDSVREYIEAPMTATVFSKENKPPNREVITAEIIYHWMISMNIPFECQKWHLNRLLTLIQVCSIKNAPPKKTNKKELLNKQRTLNEARKAAMNTKG
jgi:hypothetical protein